MTIKNLSKLASLIALAGTALAACSSDTAEPPPPPPAEPDALISAEKVTVQPGADETWCTYVTLDSDVDVDVSRFVIDQDAHHAILYAVDHPINRKAERCAQGGQPTGWLNLVIGQEHHTDIALPEGVGYQLKAGTQFAIESHVINASDKPIAAGATVGLYYAKTPVTQHAGAFYFGSQNIGLEPHAKGEARGTCSPPFDVPIHMMYGHQHAHGTGVSVSLIPDGTGAPVEVYASKTWDNASLKTWDGDGLVLKTTDQIDVRCTYDNTTGEKIGYPEEMCWAFGFGWPMDIGLNLSAAGGVSSTVCTAFALGGPSPAGATGSATIDVSRTDTVPGAGGDLTKGKPYCFLYTPGTYGPAGPTASPPYYSNALGATLPTAADKATVSFADVAEGDYIAVCMLDVVYGGFVPGPGDVVSTAPPVVHVTAGASIAAATTLDFAIP